jgi:hypothetical protein
MLTAGTPAGGGRADTTAGGRQADTPAGATLQMGIHTCLILTLREREDTEGAPSAHRGGREDAEARSIGSIICA